MEISEGGDISETFSIFSCDMAESEQALLWVSGFALIAYVEMQTTMKKLKEGTKGQKQIVTENKETLTFYRTLAFTAVAIYVVGMLVFSHFRTIDVLLTLFAVMLYAGGYKFMVHMSKPKYSETGHLIDSGIDLNMNGGVAEHVKDLMILTTGCQVLSLYSNYFWLLWLFAPARGGWMLWENVLLPCLTDQSQGNTETDEKKQRKLERRMRRQQSH